jgi:hypothetical protein
MSRMKLVVVLLCLAAGLGATSLARADVPPLQGAAALRADASEYAARVGVPFDEALRRLELQQGPLADLQQALERDQADRFGGLYIEHSPRFRVVVLMTRQLPYG